MIDNGAYCPSCKANQMPPWKSASETARKCQGCGVVEERQIVMRKRGYYWVILKVPTSKPLQESLVLKIDKLLDDLQICFWSGKYWYACGFAQSIFDVDVEVKGRVIEGEWKE